jgi:hypothetical protein
MTFRLGVLIGLACGVLLVSIHHKRKEARLDAKMNQRTTELNKQLVAIKQDRQDEKRVGRLIK